MDQISINFLHRCRAEVDTEEQTYKLWMVLTPSQNTTHCLNYNLRTEAFYVYQNQGFQAAVMAESGNSRILVGVGRSGYVHWINTTNTDAGTAIDETYVSHFNYETDPTVATKSHTLSLFFAPTSSGTLYYRDRFDFSSEFTPRTTFAFTNTTSVVHLTHTVDVPVTRNIYQFLLTSSANQANPWRLTGSWFHGVPLGVGKG